MKNKILPLIILVLAIIGNVAAYILRNPIEFGVCQKTYLFNNQKTCVDNIDFALGEPLQIFSLAVLLISISLFFVQSKVIKMWLKFALPWIAISIFFVWNVPTYSSSIVPLEKGVVSLFMAALLLVISLIIIIVKSRKLRQAEKMHRIEVLQS